MSDFESIGDILKRLKVVKEKEKTNRNPKQAEQKVILSKQQHNGREQKL